MQNNSPAGQIVQSLVQFRRWWMLPTLLCTVAAVGYALFASKTYSARQTLVVRDDLVGTFFKPGRFDSLDSLKSAQETILEISRRPVVVRNALEKIGPPPLTSAKSWLSDETVEETQGKIQISAPNGAEFGRTEAIVLSVKTSSRERSKRFITFLLDEIESSLRELRSQQFDSMRKELRLAATIAEKSYQTTAAELKQFESKIGPDLSTLISLNDAQAGTNNLQSELTNLSIEQRNAWANLEDVKKQIQILKEISENPEDLLQVPQELLQLQPTLASLATGLNEAILAYSRSNGRYRPQHPKVREDSRSVQDIKQRINDKLVQTLGSLNYQLELREGKHNHISRLINEKRIRLGELSSMRVDYSTLQEDVAKKRETKGESQANLVEIQSLGGAAKNITLISRIDEPQSEVYADGPSNKLIVFGGMAAGLFIGFGLVMFVAPLEESLLSAGSRTGPTISPERTDQPRSFDEPTHGFKEPAPNTISAQIQKKSTPTVADAEPEPVQPLNQTSPTIPKTPIQKAFESVQETRPTASALEMSSFEKPELSNVAMLDPTLPDQQKEATVDRYFSETDDSSHESQLSNEPGAGTDSSSSNVEPAQKMVGGLFGTSSGYEQTIADNDADLSSEDHNSDPIQSIQVPMVDDSMVDDSIVGADSSFVEHGSTALTVETRSVAEPEYVRTPGKPGLAAESDIDFSSLRVGNVGTESIAAKISQLEQDELGSQNATSKTDRPISTNAITNVIDQTDEPPSADHTSAGLPLETSIQNSSNAQTFGNESDPEIGKKPENRPTATTVDLRMLKNQLSGRSESKSEPPQKTLSDVLSKFESNEPDDNALDQAVDQSIADLANSISNVCKRKEAPASE